MTHQNTVQLISADKLRAHPDNPRKELGDITELTDSIKANGILQNLTVVPDQEAAKDAEGYLIVIGHRRYAAGKAAGLTEFPCVIRELTYADQVKMMLCENIQRNDLTVVEQAQGFQMMIDLGASVAELSKDTGFAPSTIYHRLNIAKLDKKTLKNNPQYTINDLIELEKIDDIKKRNNLLKEDSTLPLRIRIKQEYARQEKTKVAARVKKRLEAAGLIEREENTWSNKLEKYELTYLDPDTDPDNIELTYKNSDGVSVKYTHYYINTSYGLLTYTLKKEQKKKESPEDKMRREIDKQIKELWADINNEAHEITESIRFFQDDAIRNEKKYEREAVDMFVAETFLYLTAASTHPANLKPFTDKALRVESPWNRGYDNLYKYDEYYAEKRTALMENIRMTPIAWGTTILAELAAEITDVQQITESCNEYNWTKGRILKREHLYKLNWIASILKYLDFELYEDQKNLLKGVGETFDQISKLAKEYKALS